MTGMLKPIRCTLTPNVLAVSQLTTWEFPTFKALIASMPSEPETSKEASELLLCVADWHELYRENCNVRHFGRLFMADFDRLDLDQAAQVLTVVEERALSCYFYTTYNHMSEKKGRTWCFRLLLELATEYPAHQHLAVWDGVNAMFHGLVDPKTRVQQIPYYLPAHPIGDTHHQEHIYEGQPLGIAEFAAEAPAAPAPGTEGPVDYERTEALDKSRVLASVEGWARYQGQNPERIEKARVAKDAKRILQDKEPVTIQPGQGGRHAWMVTLAGHLARQFPRVPPEVVCEHFRTIGWDHFQAGDVKEHGIERLSRMVDDFQCMELERLAQIEADRIEEQRKAILLATGGERDHPITPDEIQALEQKFGVGWPALVVLQHQSAHWLMHPDGSYHIKMWKKEELMLAARDHFPIFGDCVSMFYEDPRTEELRRHNYESFRTEYATALIEVRYDQTLTETQYDPHRKSLAIACAAPQVKPVFHQSVQDWLLMVGGDVLVDMTAGMSRLTEMLPALVLTGGPGTGKTLYANGVGHIWGVDPNEAEDAHTRFNADQMIRQPVTFHDEKAGDAYKMEGTSLVRRFTTQGERWIEAKYMPKVALHGFPRLIFAANNPHILDTQESMTSDDREAFASRLVHIHLEPEHATWCERHLERTQRDWIGKHHLSEHFYWLGLNWEIRNPGKRFLVQGPRTKLHESLAGGAGTAAEVIQWLLSYLASPDRLDCTAGAPLALCKEKHHFRITAAAILQHWEQYLKTPPPKATADVQKALSSLSLPGRAKVPVPTGQGQTKRVNAYSVDLDILRANLDRHHLTEEEFDKALGITPAPF